MDVVMLKNNSNKPHFFNEKFTSERKKRDIFKVKFNNKNSFNFENDKREEDFNKLYNGVSYNNIIFNNIRNLFKFKIHFFDGKSFKNIINFPKITSTNTNNSNINKRNNNSRINDTKSHNPFKNILLKNLLI